MKIQYRISFFILLFLLLPHLNIQSQQQNSAAYNILLPNKDGTILSLDKNVGKYVYLHFWASWCPQSLIEMASLNDIYAHYQAASFSDAEGFEIYSVSLDSDKNEWLNKLGSNGLIWPQQVCDFKSYASPVCRQYQVTNTPTSFLISSNGTIIAQNIRPKELEAFLAEQQSKAHYGSSRNELIQTFSQNANNPTYKIQLGVFKYPNLQKFAHIQHLGKLETETTPEGYTRITLGSFGSEAETNAVLGQVKGQENCGKAFVLAVPNDILPAANEQKNDFWANAQNYNTGITPSVELKKADESTFYDQEFKALMSKPIVEKVPETIVPDFGISDDVFSKQDNRQVKVTIYAPKEQPPSIRVIERVQNEPTPQIAINSNANYSPNQINKTKTATSKPAAAPSFVAKPVEIKTAVSATVAPTPSVENGINIAYGISDSYTKPNEIGAVTTKIITPPAAKTTVATTTVEDKKPTADIPTYDYNAGLERTKQQEQTNKTAETDKNWVAPEYYPSQHNQQWRDYSVANKAANTTKSDANWDPKQQSAVPAPPKVEKQTIVAETEDKKGKKETYNYNNKKKTNKGANAIPSSENFKWEPKKSHTYPTTYPRKETELPLPDNVDIPKYEYPKKKVEEDKKTKEDGEKVLEAVDKLTRRERRKKKRLEKKK